MILESKTHRLLIVFSFFIFLIFSALTVNSRIITPLNKVIHEQLTSESVLIQRVFSFVSDVLHPTFLLGIALLISLTLFIKKRYKEAIFTVLAPALAIGLALVFKEVFRVDRPVGVITEEGWSFPSNHATAAAALFFSLFYTFRGKVKFFVREKPLWLVLGIALSVSALSRLFLGVHWFSDIVGGVFLGTFVSATLALVMIRREESKSGL